MSSHSDIKTLIKHLDEAEVLASQFSGGYSDHFFSAEEFYSEIKNTIAQLKTGNMAVINNLFLWFSPSYDWDDFTGKDGEKLGNKIFSVLLRLINS